MRISEFEKEAIIKCAKKHFQNCKVYLFGSRVDDNKKGGDIDLYIQVNYKPEPIKKIKFLVDLKNLIGYQKIDVIIYYPNKKIKKIDKEAIKGIRLC